MVTLSRRQFRVLLGGVGSVFVISVGALVLGFVSMARANDTFPDVPTTSPFHDAVGNFFDAGCATGFPDGTYRPQDPVNRQQMARFVNACGGRVAFSEQGLNPIPGTFVDLTGIDVRAGALGTGGGFILAIATIEAEHVAGTSTTCEVSASMSQTGGNAGGNDSVRLNIFETGETDEAVASLMDVIPVDAGDQVHITISTRVDNSPNCSADTINGDYQLAALYVPFAGDGTGGGAP